MPAASDRDRATVTAVGAKNEANRLCPARADQTRERKDLPPMDRERDVADSPAAAQTGDHEPRRPQRH